MIRRFDAKNVRHLQVLEALYLDPSATELFRRAPQDLAESTLAGLESLCGVCLYVLYKGNTEVGLCVLSDINPYGRNCQIGIGMLKDYRGDSVKTSQALFTEFCDFIFKTTSMEKLSVTILARQTHLADWLKAHGWELESVLKDNIFFRNEWHSEYGYACFRKAFYATKTSNEDVQ